MSYKSIRINLMQLVVTQMGRTFVTRDVSEHPSMVAAHANHRNYHAFVGRALSENRDILGIVEIRKGTSRGSRWERNGLVQPSTESFENTLDATPKVSEEHMGIGPQYKGDSAFAARMRLHQSWYRANVLGVPYGTGPTPKSASYYGNMLTAARRGRWAKLPHPRDRTGRATSSGSRKWDG